MILFFWMMSAPDLIRVPGPGKKRLQELERAAQRWRDSGNDPELGCVGNAGKKLHDLGNLDGLCSGEIFLDFGGLFRFGLHEVLAKLGYCDSAVLLLDQTCLLHHLQVVVQH